MRSLWVDRQAHAVLAGHEAVTLLQLQQQSHEVARRLDTVILERALGDLERLRDLLQQLRLHRADAALVVPDRALGESYGIGELGLRKALRLAVPPNDAAYLVVFGARDYSPNETFCTSISYGNNGTALGKPEAVRKETSI